MATCEIMNLILSMPMYTGATLVVGEAVICKVMCILAYLNVWL